MAFPSAEQAMFTLAMIADLGQITTSSSCAAERQVCGEITQALESDPAVAGNWDLVWGPCVVKFALISPFPDNVFYVVRNRVDPSQYVLAVSGTNPYALTDWVFEDFLVVDTKPWTYGAPPTNARISNSASLSLSILQGAKPCAEIPGAGEPLIEFLTDAAADSDGNVDITVAGHSLGGSLASLAALWLADTQGPNIVGSDRWDPTNKARVSAYCYAGPTAGNSDWANYFDRRVGANTHRIWNSLDIVPHVWNVDDMAEIPNLYAPTLPAPVWVQTLVRLISAEVAGDDYDQIEQSQGPLAGTVNPTIGTFVEQAVYQHVDAYFVLLGLPVPVDLTRPLRESAT